MTRPRLILAIRFWTLAAAVLAVGLLWPAIGLYLFASFAWMPLGLFMPVFETLCANCSDGTPNTLQVVMGGFTNSACGNCNTYYNGTFVVTFNSSISTSTFCRWTYTLPSACSIYNTISVQLGAGVTYALSVSIAPSGLLSNYAWNNNLGSQPDCTAWSSLSIPYDSDSIPWDIQCTGDHSAAAVTAL